MSELKPEFEKVMEQLRELEVSPNKLAEQDVAKEDDMLQVIRLNRAFGRICQEISRIDFLAGVRISLALKTLREALDGQGLHQLVKDDQL